MIDDYGTTKMTSKGQVVIPETIRKKLGLKPGTQFMVMAERDIVLLQELKPLSPEEFRKFTAAARRWARETGLKKSDIKKAIQGFRKEHRRSS
jgi:AbrB family looped-hinge helix DNA binding protein